MNRPQAIGSPRFLGIAWLAINALGAGIFLTVASSFWTEPEVAGLPGASGGAAIGWFFLAVPVFCLFVLLHIGVIVWASLVRRKRGKWPISNLFWASLPIWLLALLVDNAHH
jgi:hypothetical protein